MNGKRRIKGGCRGGVLKHVAPLMAGQQDEVLIELLHNARLAGATRIGIETHHDETSIWDDGHGIEDAGVLLEAGASGWKHVPGGETAAGIGFFSLSERLVHVQSRSASGRPWTLDLTPEHFQGKPAEVVYRDDRKAQDPGTIITWTGQSKDWAIEHLGQHFPVPIVLNGNPVRQTEFIEAKRTVKEVAWRGLRLAAYPRVHQEQDHRVCVNGTVCTLRLAGARTRHVARVEAIDCPELRLRRPGRTALLENQPFTEDLKTALLGLLERTA